MVIETFLVERVQVSDEPASTISRPTVVSSRVPELEEVNRDCRILVIVAPAVG